MIKEIRETLSNEEGQALVIGGLMMLLLAFGILVTLNIGRAVEEKIKLQNTADASAYSLAVLEAQAFNYVAFTNRVQASHYNSIMLIQGFANFLIFLEGMLGTFVDYIWTFTTILGWVGNIISLIPPVSAIGQAIVKVSDLLYKVGNFIYKLTTKLRSALYGDEEDIDGGLIPLMGGLRKILWYVNYAQYFTEAIYSGLITIKIIGGMKKMNDKNMGQNEINMKDGKAEATNKQGEMSLASVLKLMSSGLNVIEYYQTFDAVGGRPLMPKLPGTDDGLRALKKEEDAESGDESYDHFSKRKKGLRANQRIMAEIANATRSERDGTWAQKWLANNTRRGFRLPGDLSLGGFEDILEKFIDIRVEGQTKLATYIAEPKNIQIFPQGDFTGESVLRHLEEPNRGAGSPYVTSDRRYFSVSSSNDEGKDNKWYKENSKVRSDLYRPTGDVMGSYEHFHFFMGLQIDALSFLGLGKITLAECDIYPAIVSDRNGGRIYRWRLPEDWIVDLMESSWTRLYLRVPGTVWQMLGLFQTPINMCAAGTLIPIVAGLPFFGCKGVSVPRNESCRGFCFLKIFGKCVIKARCKWLPGFCCKLRKWLDQMSFKTFEKITQESSDDNLNQWWLGIGPFMKFKPDYRRSKDFNQPSTWAIVNSPPENFMDGNPWNFNDSNQELSTKGIFKQKCEDGTYDAATDTCKVVGRDNELSVNPILNDKDHFRDSAVLGIGSQGLFGPGLNVISRARVYYHRPQNWEEPPNLMNPFWRAQLAPVAQKLVPYLTGLQEKLNKILQPISDGLGDINTGIDTIDNIASGLQGIVDMLANDGLSKIVIGLITH